VERLATLLIALDAPLCLWADWSNVLIQHIHFANARVDLLHGKLRDAASAVRWSEAEDAASEGVVRSVLATAPREAWDVLQGVDAASRRRAAWVGDQEPVHAKQQR
jgi:hypothetical protein